MQEHLVLNDAPKIDANALRNQRWKLSILKHQVIGDFFSNVGNVTNVSWKHYFSTVGTVTNVRIVCDRETGRPRGFAFVEFSEEAGAQRAVDQLNGTDFNGRSLRVNLASR